MEFGNNSDYFGASILAYAKLMYTYGYLLVKIDNNAVNSFFVHLSELNMVDFPLMHWVATLSFGHSGRHKNSSGG